MEDQREQQQFMQPAMQPTPQQPTYQPDVHVSPTAPAPPPETQGAPAPGPGAPAYAQPMPPVQNIYITQQVQQQAAPAAVVAVSSKSVVLALVLTFFFGPLGMFYSTVTGALIMLVATVVFGAMTLGFGVLITWPICMIWGAVAASRTNARVTQVSMTQIGR